MLRKPYSIQAKEIMSNVLHLFEFVDTDYQIRWRTNGFTRNGRWRDEIRLRIKWHYPEPGRSSITIVGEEVIIFNDYEELWQALDRASAKRHRDGYVILGEDLRNVATRLHRKSQAC